MVVKQVVRYYEALRTDVHSKFKSFYKKMVSTVESKLADKDITSLAGNHWFSGTEEEKGSNHMTYHGREGSSLVVADGEITYGANIEIIGSERAVESALTSLVSLAAPEFKIEERD